MTKKELNRDCRRLLNRFKKGEHFDNGEIAEDFIKEFKRIYGADSSFEYLNPKYVLGLYRINQACRIEPFHFFGIQYEIK